MTSSPAELRSLRKSLGLTQADLADKLGCSQSYVSHLESGRAGSAATLERVDRVLRKVERDRSGVEAGIPSPTTADGEAAWTPQAVEAGDLPVAVDLWQRPPKGGDLFLAMALGGRSLLIFAADVTGHGTIAHSMANYLRGWIRGRALATRARPDLVSLAEELEGEMSAVGISAAWCLGMLSPGLEPEVHWQAISLGFPIPILLTDGQSRPAAVRWARSSRSHAEPESLQPPWRLVFATDGLLRRLGAGDESEGQLRLVELQSGPLRDHPLALMLETKEPLADDELCAVVRWNFWDEAYHFNVLADPARHRVKRMLRELAARDLGAPAADRVLRAVSEAFENAMRHAYRGAAHGPVGVLVRSEPDRLRVEVTDEGAGGRISEAGGFVIMRAFADGVECRGGHPAGTIVEFTFVARPEEESNG